jgi:hypothetical protein
MARPFFESTAIHEDRRGFGGTTPGTLPTTAAMDASTMDRSPRQVPP